MPYYFCHPRLFANPSSRTVVHNLIQFCNNFYLIHLIQEIFVVKKGIIAVSLLPWKLNGALCLKHDKEIQSSKNENYLFYCINDTYPKKWFIS